MAYGIGKNLRKVREVAPYREGLARTALPRVDFADAFAVDVPPDSDLEFASLARAGFEACPGWVRRMMALRDAVMGPLGLKTGREFEPTSAADWERALAELHPIYSEDGNEVLFGIDDWHLDFRASLLRQHTEGVVTLVATTLVHFKHWMGRAYFVPVRVGHKWIVPAMLAALQRRLVEVSAANSQMAGAR